MRLLSRSDRVQGPYPIYTGSGWDRRAETAIDTLRRCCRRRVRGSRNRTGVRSPRPTGASVRFQSNDPETIAAGEEPIPRGRTRTTPPGPVEESANPAGGRSSRRPQGYGSHLPLRADPPGTGGSIDLAPVLSAVRSLARELAKAPGYRLIVVKSTVVPGTTVDVIEPLLRRESGKGVRELGVACNPEFLAEGSMVRDALHPERIVLGVSDPRSAHLLREVYRRFAAPIFELSPSGAELVKYSANAFLSSEGLLRQ